MEGRHLIITGQVQGVGFRYSMVRAAQRLGASGWVRNRCDGSVEAEVYGSPETIAVMLQWARQGPPGARVDHLAVTLVQGDCSGFEQRATL